MAAPTRGNQTSPDRVQLQWSLLTSPDDGYSSITTYAVFWDAGTSGATFTDLVGVASDYLLSSYLVTTNVTSGTTYQFKVQARNYWGWGALSSAGTVKAATTPAAVASAPATTVNAATGHVDISWIAADARGDTITSYTVEIENALGAAWTAETANCGGSAALSCSVPMSVLTAAPYSLPQGHVVKVRVYATNSYGNGAYSDANTAGADVRVVPISMGAPRRGNQTSTGQIEVAWDALTSPATGGSSITSYQLLWDAGTGGAAATALVGLVSDYTQTSYLVSISGAPGSTYKFKLRPKNLYGLGADSSEVSIIASDVPSQMQVVTTSIQGTSVRIQWAAPATNGAALTAYEIVVLQKDGTTYSQDLTNCNGASLASASQCDIPLATLRASPFSLVLGDLVQVKVRAANNVGFGPYSQANVDGATI